MLTKKSIELYPVLLPFTNSYVYKFIAIENLLMILISYIIFSASNNQMCRFVYYDTQ